jgi:polyhydroxyalkanoate synthesis regulator phasin
MNSLMKSLNNVLMRIVAVFAASGLSVIGAGAIAGVDTLTAVTVAGLTAVAAVVEKLARAFMDDGKLSLDEINAAFSTVDKSAKTVADAEVETRQAADKVIAAGLIAVPAVAAVEAVAEEVTDPTTEEDYN